MKCQFVGGGNKYLPNPADYHCKEEATHVYTGNKRVWYFCNKHYEAAIKFLKEVKIAVGGNR